MASNAHHLKVENEQISTFAVIDLETTNLPAYCQNRVSITELCIYAFDPVILKDNDASEEKTQLRGELTPRSPKVLPLPPRVLHKLNLLFQPSMAVSLEAQRITGMQKIKVTNLHINVNVCEFQVWITTFWSVSQG